MTRPIGIYEKATPKHFSWRERLEFAKEMGFDFVEMSVDESDACWRVSLGLKKNV